MLGRPEYSHLVPAPTQAQGKYPDLWLCCECQEYILLKKGTSQAITSADPLKKHARGFARVCLER